MADLVLQHKEIKSHKEYWTVEDGYIHILIDCPQNYPSKDEFDFTPIGALKQYALMTSLVENWEIVQESDAWHKFLDNIVVED